MIKTQQELIQIGSSEGVILSKKDLARIGAKRGDILNLKYELAQKQAPQTELTREYESFVAKIWTGSKEPCRPVTRDDVSLEYS